MPKKSPTTGPRSDVVVAKRDGRPEPFLPAKIVDAVRRCMLSIRSSPAEAARVSELVGSRVTNIVSQYTARADGPVSVGIEDIQRLVIQQLWAESLFAAAEHYTIYREDRRKVRERQPIDEEEIRAFEADERQFPTSLQRYQFVSKFSRWREDKNRRETWREAHGRVMSFFRRQEGIHLTESEWHELDDAFFNLEATPAMRVLQMAGPALDRCNVAAFNCSYLPISDLRSFAELLYILMQGTGVGFSVESDYVDELPRIKRQKKGVAVRKMTVEDSTDGWCDAVFEGLKTWFAGEDVEYDFTQIRPAGARLKIKGGRASGPEPLRHLLTFIRTRVLSRQGKYLRPIDCHDICCMIGKIVQVGGVRRASEISLSDLDDEDLRYAKDGSWWNNSPWRDMANNSAVYDEKPDAVSFMEEWLALAKSGSGERGIFNRYGVLRACPARRKKAKFGTNPCGEVILPPYTFCNLSIVVARHGDTEDTLKRKVRAATIFGVMQSTLTRFGYIRDEWRKNCEEERLLGVDITGQMDCPLLRPSNPDREALLQRLFKVVEETAREYAERFGINVSAAMTCVKPSGDSSQFFSCSSGIHARHAAYYIRRVRGGIHDPVTQLLKDEGVPWHVDPFNESLVVFDFPVKSPEGAVVKGDLTAIEQLENWLVWKKHWAEHSVSCTVSVKPDEWISVGNWVYEHFDDVTGLSFLPDDGGTYELAPYEEITADEYERLAAVFPKIDWAKLRRYEQEDHTTAAREYACTANGCEM